MQLLASNTEESFSRLSSHVNEEFGKGKAMIVELQTMLQNTFKNIFDSHSHLHSQTEYINSSITQVDANSNLLHGSLSSLHTHLETTMMNQGTHISMIERV